MSINVKSTIKLNNSVLKALDIASIISLEKTGQSLLTEVRNDEVMPFDTGTLQNDNTSVTEYNPSKRGVQIVSNTPYSRRLYYHPEYNYQKVNNSKAGGEWLEDYVTGDKKAFCKNAFAQIYKEEARL